jgi:hypothetical protein
VTVNKERVRLLVDALRSGRYQQCRLSLREQIAGIGIMTTPKYGYCCLGVATQIAVDHGVIQGSDTYIWGHTGLPTAVREWYGFDDGNPAFPGQSTVDGHTLTAIYANDHARLDFQLIAGLFENTYLREEVPA